MKVDVLLGLQWGDEGKGKIVDFLAPKYDVVARFQGGPNAGHTLEFEGIKHVLHQIPSGIFRSDIRNIVGNGVVLDAVIFKKEVEALAPFNLDVKKNLFLSTRAQLILPTHQLLDAAYEQAKGDKKIGSTLKGIGPTYQDKIGRLGLRVGDIRLDNFKSRYQALRDRHVRILDSMGFEYDLEPREKLFFEAVDFLKEFTLVESEYMINEELANGAPVLAEGAQGSLLDIDFGSYPFVTSSNTMTAGACTGLGVAPGRIGEVFGIFKAYCTRVGSGPFPTELFDEDGKKMQDEGNEFGATTGRPRRCGWLDLVALRYTAMLNGVTQLFMMKSDVLSVFDEIRICTQYRMPDGSLTDQFPYDIKNKEIKPVYTTLKGWKTDITRTNDWGALPQELKDYVNFLEKELDLPINLISTGPDRSQTILRETAAV